MKLMMTMMMVVVVVVVMMMCNIFTFPCNMILIWSGTDIITQQAQVQDANPFHCLFISLHFLNKTHSTSFAGVQACNMQADCLLPANP